MCIPILKEERLKAIIKNYGAKVDRFESLSKRKNGFTASFPGPKTHTKKTNPTVVTSISIYN